MSNFVTLLVIGGALGWLASVATRADGQDSILLNLVAGAVGSYLGSVLLEPMIRIGPAGHWIAAIAGSIFLLAAIGLGRRARLL